MHCCTSKNLTQNQKKLFKGLIPTTNLEFPYSVKSIKQRRAYLTHYPQRLNSLVMATPWLNMGFNFGLKSKPSRTLY